MFTKHAFVKSSLVLLICLYRGVHRLSGPPRLSPRVAVGIPAGSCVVPCLSQFSPLNMLRAKSPCVTWLLRGSGRLGGAGFQGTVSAEAICLQPQTCCSCELDHVSGSWPLGTGDRGHIVWPSSQAPFWEYGTLVPLNLALVFCPGC